MLQPARSAKPGTRKRVGQALYRYTASGSYFAYVRIGGKLFRESLKTAERRDAEQKLADFRRQKQTLDMSPDKLSLSALGDKYEGTVRRLSSSSQKAKPGIIGRIKAEWPGGAEQLIRKVKPPIAKRGWGSSSHASGARITMPTCR